MERQKEFIGEGHRFFDIIRRGGTITRDIAADPRDYAGGVGYVFGPVVMVIGHAFNLAMGVLGAYIHDCRLQYIEFFSKFYTGEGELFAPLGSSVRYIHFSK